MVKLEGRRLVIYKEVRLEAFKTNVRIPLPYRPQMVKMRGGSAAAKFEHDMTWEHCLQQIPSNMKNYYVLL